jgi:hypothetical protein
MKITLNILISFLLLISTSGIYISQHFCCNKLVSVSFFSDAKKCCEGDCPFCKNINHTYKVKTRYIQSETLNFNKVDNLISLFNLPSAYTVILNTITESPLVIINQPPGKSVIPIYFSKLRL